MTTDPGAHLTLLRAIAKGDAATLRRVLVDPATDVAGYLHFAHRHRLGAYSYWQLRRLELTPLLPRAVLAATKASSLVERAQGERLVAGLTDLAERLDRRGLRALFLKGPLFAERFYGAVAARGCADLDILVRPADVDRIEPLLLDAGFTPAFSILGSRRLTRYFAHHFEYRRDAVPLDVHWALQRHFSFAIDYRRIWATATRVTLGGRAFEATSDEYELVLQILGVLTDLQVGKLVLRSLVDVYRVLKAVDGTLDWDAFFADRAHERVHRPAVYVLTLVLDVLDCGDELPALRAVLAGELGRVPPTAFARRAVLESRPFDVRQKLLALRIYEASLASSLAWWLVSLPFRFAVYGVTRPR